MALLPRRPSPSVAQIPRTKFKILVTGSAGVLGLAVCPALEAAGFRVVPFDRARDPRQDLSVAGAVDGPLRACDGVLHLAGCARVGVAEEDPRRAARDNVLASEALIEALTRVAPPAWLVFASSREVYGQARSLPVREDAPLDPVNTYGATKAEVERLLLRSELAAGRLAIARLSNVYGADHDHPDRLVPALLRAARQGAPLTVRGSTRSFDLVHIDDVTRGLVALCLRLHRGHPAPLTVNLGGGRPVSLGDLARRVRALAASPSPVLEEPPPAREAEHFLADLSLAARDLGWRPQVGLDRGLAELLRLPDSDLHSSLEQ